MSVNNNSFNYNVRLPENEKTPPVEQDALPLPQLPQDVLEQIFLHIGFTGLQKASCLSKIWNVSFYLLAVKLEFSHVESFANDQITQYEEHCKIQSRQVDTRNINKIADLLNIASKVLNFSIIENPQYLSTHKEDLIYLEKAQKSLYKHNTKSLMDLELTLHTLMSSITTFIELTESEINYHTLSQPIKSMFKINEFNNGNYLTHNINTNYFKLLAIKNNTIDDALAGITNYCSFEDLFYSLMSSKHFDLAKPLNSKIGTESINYLASSLVRFGYLESALEWLKTETDLLRKQNIVSGMLQGLFSFENGLSMNVIFETLDFILNQEFEVKIESSLKLESLTYWFERYKIKKSDDISFAIKIASQFPESYQTIMNHGLFLGLIKQNPIHEVYNSEIVNQLIPNNKIKNEVLLKSFFSYSFSYEKTMEIAGFIPEVFYYKKEDFLLKLGEINSKNINEVTSVLKKYSSPQNYIINLVNEHQTDKFLTFLNEVPKDVYLQIKEKPPETLTSIAYALAENGYREKAKELVAMIPVGEFPQFWIKKYNL